MIRLSSTARALLVEARDRGGMLDVSPAEDRILIVRALVNAGLFRLRGATVAKRLVVLTYLLTEEGAEVARVVGAS